MQPESAPAGQGGSSGDEETFVFDASTPIAEMSTAQLTAMAFPTREDFDRWISPDRNAGSRAEWVADIARRHRDGFRVRDTELAEARGALAEMQKLRGEASAYLRATEAVSKLNFGRAA